jgi:UDP-N-acetylmuramoyl-tripeptide--D-alanyl-D-alanine ligase
MDAYNANPTSTELALENFSHTDYKNKVAILGDMFELGVDAAAEHQYIVNIAEKLNIDRCVFVGEHYFKTSAKEKYKTTDSLKEQLLKEPILDNYILIKGSRGMALERILDLIN